MDSQNFTKKFKTHFVENMFDSEQNILQFSNKIIIIYLFLAFLFIDALVFLFGAWFLDNLLTKKFIWYHAQLKSGFWVLIILGSIYECITRGNYEKL